MSWLVTGARGMLGVDLVAELTRRGEDVTAVDRDEVDITSAAAVAEAVVGHTVVVNCAAWTAVDAAEDREGEAFLVNAVGPATLARAAARAGVRVVHVSTDYVFDGNASEPYAEDAAMTPRSAYGRTKAAGEWAVRAETADHLIVRTAWLYGAGGACFPRTIARVARERGHVDVVDDQFGQPTWSVDLARVIADLVSQRAPSGTYHATASGMTSWYGFARAVVTAAGLDAAIVGATSSYAFAGPAPRPPYSVLGHSGLRSTGVPLVGPWDQRWAAAAAAVLGDL